MKKLDFISGAPKTFIFQQDSNKTNLGGILTILFILAMLIIMYSYIYEYFANDKYNVSYYYNEVYYEDEKLDEIYSNEDLFPKLDYLFILASLTQEQEGILNDLIVLDSNREEIPLIQVRNTRVSDLDFNLFYKCKNESYCGTEDGNNNPNLFLLMFKYYGYFCDHQNPESPIRREINYKVFPFTIDDRIYIHLFNWKIIKYEEESSFSGMFRRTKKNYGGMLFETEKYSIPSEGFPLYEKMNNETGKMEYYRYIAGFNFWRSNFGYYDNYSRERISIFDAIANICALVSTLYGVVTFIFCGFYSNSFDNYKIIEKIISRGAYINTKNIKDIKEDIPKERIKEQIELKDQIENDVKDNLIDVKEDNDDKKMLDDDKEKEADLDPLFKIPKFHFYDFLYNNVYFDCCKPSTTQGIISSCNDLITKYYSIDAVIYNQLRLENLFKDYKWNNPQLNNIENNDILLQIKTLSGNLTGS